MKVRYEGVILTEPIRGKDLYIIRGELRIHWQNGKQDAGIIVVPESFITDFASVPRPARMVISPLDAVIRDAALAHDRIYEQHAYGSRAFADALLFAGMEPLGAWEWQRWAVWLAVRAGGYWAYSSGPQRQHERLAHIANLQQ